MLVALAAAGQAGAHLIHPSGVWTYRYLSRGSDKPLTYCSTGAFGVDPLNVLIYQYGEANRMNGHLADETHWSHYEGWAPRDHQIVCGDSDELEGDYTVNIENQFDDLEGHGSWSSQTRAHFRIWFAPHGHTQHVNKWSTLDVHHERRVCCWSHTIDEPWDTWEYHATTETDGHNLWIDYYWRVGGQPIQGFYDNGYITRLGGMHNGVYP
jgi:hypothetical protein